MNATVLDALEKMSEYGVSSIPVVDQNGHLMGNISMADVRVLPPRFVIFLSWI